MEATRSIKTNSSVVVSDLRLEDLDSSFKDKDKHINPVSTTRFDGPS